ncbi:uncharacterized protein F5891DRAFT_902774, partial [Suillus fuscotomentosus]
FIFVSSTCAGGVRLGINQTAGDTVDHDRNPSNNAQATYYQSRAHCLGQTRQVTVYQRLITRGTIDERIIQ